MKEELRNINVDEKLKENLMTALGSSDINDTTGVHSIAGNMKRNMMDFEFLMAETDEAIDGNNYFALLRFVFSQDYNRADILRIENKRIPNKYTLLFSFSIYPIPFTHQTIVLQYSNPFLFNSTDISIYISR